MKLLQCFWHPEGGLYFSAETKQLNDAIQDQEQGDPIHPRAVDRGGLEEIMASLDFEADAVGSLMVALPTVDGQPLANPRLFVDDDRDDAQKRVSLTYWSLPCLIMNPLSAVGFLTSLPTNLPRGICLDHSLTYWQEITKLLLELLSHGRFLPELRRENDLYYANWQLILSDGDQRRIDILAQAMPPVLRAIRSQGDNRDFTLLEKDPRWLISSFLESTADALIRAFLSRFSLRPKEEISRPTSKRELCVNWLTKLTDKDRLVVGGISNLVELEQQLKRWKSKLAPKAISHRLRTVIKLSSFDVEARSPSWKLEFLLQSETDPENILYAENLWRGHLGFLANSEHSSDDLEELLLCSLAKASHIYPKLADALEETHPTHLILSTNEAYEFLATHSVLLERIGVGIISPHWWQTRSSSIGLHLHLKPIHTYSLQVSNEDSGLALDKIVNYSWKVAIGESVLSLEEFEDLVQKNSPLVQIREQWVELNPHKVKQALSFLKEQGQDQSLDSTMTIVEALRLGLGADNDRVGLPVTGFSASGWINDLLNPQSTTFRLTQQPDSLVGQLRPYQLEGLSWLAMLSLARIGACLADDMGLGKTIQVLALLLHERQSSANASSPERIAPTLLFAPMSVLFNWEAEVNKFAPSLKAHVHHGALRLSGQEFLQLAQNVDLIITTYNLGYRDEQLLSSMPWHRIVLDEAQNIKNLGSKQTQSIRRIALGNELSNDTQSSDISTSQHHCHRLALTGTPLENHLEELWSILDFLNPGLLGSLGNFRSKYTIPIERYRDSKASENLAKLVRPFILRRQKSDPTIIDDLPEKVEMGVDTVLTLEQASLYQNVLDSMLDTVGQAEGIHRKGLVLAMITKLKQICNHPALFLRDNDIASSRSGKLQRLEEILEVLLCEGDKVLIFTQFAQMGKILQAFLQDRFNQEVLFMHGGVAQKNRKQMVELYQDSAKPQIFVLSLKTGGYGLNLTAANQVIHLDQWWNPATHEQATDRAYRIGQKRKVQVRKFICKGTLEERINNLLLQKQELADSVVNNAKSSVTQLDTQALRQLLELTTSPDNSL